MKKIPFPSKRFLFLCLLSVSSFLTCGAYVQAQGSESLDFFQNSTSTANCCVAPVLEASPMPLCSDFSAPLASCTSSAEASFERSLLIVTASDYCAFLNASAAFDADDLYPLYSEAMASDPSTASIVRVGTPGRWHYEVIAGRENFPVAYVNEMDKEKYVSETGCLFSNDDRNIDPWLRSNTRGLQVINSGTSALTLATSTNSSQSSSGSFLEEAAGVAGLIGLIAFCPELMMRVGNDAGRAGNEGSEIDGSLDSSSHSESSSVGSKASAQTTASTERRDHYALNFNDFREAVFDYPMAQRLMIDHEDTGMIQPFQKTSLNIFENNKKNKMIRLVFKDALKEEYANLLGDFYSSDLTSKMIRGQKNQMFSSLGSAKILEYINEIERRITEKIKASKESDLEILSSHLERKKTIAAQAQEFFDKHQAELQKGSKKKSFVEKTAHNISALSEVIGDGAVSVAGFSASLGVPLQIATTGFQALDRAQKKAPMKSARDIVDEAKADLDQLQERVTLLEKKAKKERVVNFNDSSVQLEAQSLWVKAVEKESEANAALSLDRNLKEDLGVCRRVSIAWSKAAEAKAKHLAKATSQRDIDLLADDVVAAENKVKEWKERLESMRPKKNSPGSELNSMDGSPKETEFITNLVTETETKMEADSYLDQLKSDEEPNPIAKNPTSEDFFSETDRLTKREADKVAKKAWVDYIQTSKVAKITKAAAMTAERAAEAAKEVRRAPEAKILSVKADKAIQQAKGFGLTNIWPFHKESNLSSLSTKAKVAVPCLESVPQTLNVYSYEFNELEDDISIEDLYMCSYEQAMYSSQPNYSCQANAEEDDTSVGDIAWEAKTQLTDAESRFIKAAQVVEELRSRPAAAWATAQRATWVEAARIARKKAAKDAENAEAAKTEAAKKVIAKIKSARIADAQTKSAVAKETGAMDQFLKADQLDKAIRNEDRAEADRVVRAAIERSASFRDDLMRSLSQEDYRATLSELVTNENKIAEERLEFTNNEVDRIARASEVSSALEAARGKLKRATVAVDRAKATWDKTHKDYKAAVDAFTSADRRASKAKLKVERTNRTRSFSYSG